MIQGECFDFEGYNKPEAAYQGHLRYVTKWEALSESKQTSARTS